MRTRRSFYSSPSDHDGGGITFLIRPKTPSADHLRRPSDKRRRLDLSSPPPLTATAAPNVSSSASFFDSLPDDLLLSILASLASSATSPSHLINAMLACKRFCAAGAHPLVLAIVSPPALAIKARAWSDGARRFLQRCADSGNAEAAYVLGMIRFYCLKEKQAGASLMAYAALRAQHSEALHSLAIIHFNGSGGRIGASNISNITNVNRKNLRCGAALCAKAAARGHVGAMRELGHCLLDGYGVQKNVEEGRRLLVKANAMEAVEALLGGPHVTNRCLAALRALRQGCGCRCTNVNTHLMHLCAAAEALLRGPHVIDRCMEALQAIIQGCGCRCANVYAQKMHLRAAKETSECTRLKHRSPVRGIHAANRFLIEWFAARPAASERLALCAHGGCGRIESRRHEFRRCSACGVANYCSRSCQSLDWALRHKRECSFAHPGPRQVHNT